MHVFVLCLGIFVCDYKINSTRQTISESKLCDLLIGLLCGRLSKRTQLYCFWSLVHFLVDIRHKK